MWVLNENSSRAVSALLATFISVALALPASIGAIGQTTAGSFVLLPTTGERVYRTGDRGRWHRSGYIEFRPRRPTGETAGFSRRLGDVEFALKRRELVAEVRRLSR